MSTVVVKHHRAGFFSCCALRLYDIIDYFNTHQQLPEIVDSSIQFDWYKVNNNKEDITFGYFDHYNNHSTFDFVNKINFHWEYQFEDYSNINFDVFSPFMVKYFSPSLEVQQRITHLEKKYNICYENICVLFYRGNDKSTETKLSSYDEYILYTKEILIREPSTVFFIQSDETEFIDMMSGLFPDNSFFMKDEIRHIPKCKNTVDHLMRDNIDLFSKLYLAITIMMSKCKYIICGSGNCSIWIMLYRGNAKNVYQHCVDKWITPKMGIDIDTSL